MLLFLRVWGAVVVWVGGSVFFKLSEASGFRGLGLLWLQCSG